MEVHDPVQVYLREVAAVPPLMPEEETQLIQRIRAQDDQAESAKVRLLEANLRIVVSIAESYRNAPIHILDLIQKGNEGLLVAVKTLASTSTGSFSDHAARCIHQAIEEAVRKPQ